jgi:hypothetical protein
MAFPTDPLPVLVEMKIGSTFTNITSDVLVRDEIDITRGKQPEAGQAAPQTCRLTLNNRAGKYSPRNPLSPYYGQIGRNTELRVAIEVDPVFDAHSSTTGTGNLSWTHTPVGSPTGVVVFVWQYNTTANQIFGITYGGVAMQEKSVTLHTLGAVNAVGYMYFLNRNIPTGPQTVAVSTNGVVTQRQASAITVTGGTNAEVDAYSFGNSGATPSVNPNISLSTFKRAVLFGSLLSDLDSGATIAPGAGYTELVKTALGTEVVDVERATVQPAGGYTVNWTAASAGWGIIAMAVRTVYYRFWGEVSSFPPKWDTSTNDAYVPIEASGITRRLGQGTEPSETGLRKFIYPGARLFRYWPLSGASGTKYSLDIAPVWGSGGTNYKFSSESVSQTNFGYGVDMGAEFLGTGMAFFSSVSPHGPMRGDIGSGDANWAVDFVFSTIESTGGMGNFTLICPGYDNIQWELNFNAGVAQVTWNDTVGPIVYPASPVLPELRDLGPHHVRFQVTESVSQSAQWTLFIDGVQIDTGTQLGYFQVGLALARFYMVRAAGQERINLAHVAVWSMPSTYPTFPAVPDWPSAAAVSAAARGYAGEVAGTRISRICGLAAVPVTTIGVLANTTAMGVQHSESMLTQIRDAESTDLGILTESRDALGLLYRTRASLYNQSAKATISMSAGELAPPFEPVDDDQATRNDVTAVRRDGGSVQVTDTTSRLSTAAPPAGVGPYKDEVTLNVETDGQLQGMAGWLLNLGTIDEARFPYIAVDRANRIVVANATLSAALMAVDIGDRIAITSATRANIYDDISVIALGYNERLGPFGHTIVFNCTPESPYRVAVYGSGVGTGPDRYDAQGSQLGGALTSTATSFTAVTSGASPTLWTNAAGEFPFDIKVGGERMTVTNITSATSPQTFTVTRSVNGVIKSHSAGAEIRLWKTPRYAL